MPRTAANVAQSLLFGLSHLAVLYQGPLAPFVPLTVVAGFLFGLSVQRTGSIWPAIVVHAYADIAITAVVIPGLYGF
jgi:membrane protease YdiL (CAAX protease family)